MYNNIFNEDKRNEYFINNLRIWHIKNKRNLPWRETKDPYIILIVEKLLQQTSYKHVLNIYQGFFLKYPTIKSLSEANTKEIETTIKPLGFYRQRSVQIKKIVDIIITKYDGKIPNDQEKLIDLPGIGPYISNAVLCFAYDKRVPIIDVNVKRIINRYFSFEFLNDEKIYKKILTILPENSIKDFNWSLLDFGSLICIKNPRCKICILKSNCRYYFNKAKID